MVVYYRNISVSVTSTITSLTNIVADLSRNGGCADLIRRAVFTLRAEILSLCIKYETKIATTKLVLKMVLLLDHG